MLTGQQAIEIYKFKVDLLAQSKKISETRLYASPSLKIRGASLRYAKVYGVSSRCIRDIWNRRSWGYATSGLWEKDCKCFRNCGEEIKVPEVRLFLINYLWSPLLIVHDRR